MSFLSIDFLFVFFITIILQACTVQQGANSGGVSSTNNNQNPPIVNQPPSTNNPPSSQVKVLSLWSRSPVQAAGYMATATDNLETLNRQSVALYDLNNLSGNLMGSNVNVYYKPEEMTSPKVTAYGSSRIPWSNRDFQAYMTYAHASAAYKYIKTLYPTLNFQIHGKNLFPIPTFSDLRGSAFETGYVPNYSSSVPGALMFYREDSVSFPYNTNDEADAIYHEVGHSFQHVLNASVMETSGNYDMDMLLEGLADFFAASALRDDKFGLYLEANAPVAYGPDNRTGPNQQRRMDGDVTYPNGYVGEFHLDGRVISSALNDIRKYFDNETVIVFQPTRTSIQWAARLALTKDQAFDRVFVASHEALREMIPSSTILFYTQKLIDKLMLADWSASCGTDASCLSRVRSDIQSILISRGIYKSSNLRSVAFSAGGTGGSQDVIFSDNFYAMPLSSSSGYSNTNSYVDKCEALLVVPSFSLNTGVQQSIYDVNFRLKAAYGLSAFHAIDVLTAPSSASSQEGLKLFGFLLPGENTYQAIANGRFYNDHQGSHLASTSLTSINPSPLGWAVRAPASAQVSANTSDANSTGKITFDIRYRPFEVLNAPSAIYSSYTFTQSIHVANGAADFCSKN